ncbi:MAG: hypothetical protein NTU86_07295 [Burkholderiales bacterium]|nr:hypothetical protein [Burkholderiales bacterium]
MFSSFRGKGAKSADPAPKEGAKPRGLEVIEDDPDTVWSMWDSALAEQDSRLGVADTAPVAPGAPSPAAPAPSARAPTAMPAPVPPAQEPEIPTQPVALDEMSDGQKKDEALAIVELHHKRIANTIRTLWGYKECSEYIYKLIMNGGDGMGQARIGFNQDAAAAMLALADLHDAQFGAKEEGTLGFGHTDKRR